MWLAVALVIVAAIAMAPLFIVLGRRSARGRRESAEALYRAQLRDLERDAADGKLAAPEKAAAKLEVERRLLTEAETEEAPIRQGRTHAALALLLAIPVVAGVLYLVNGQPELPPEPYAKIEAQVKATQARDDALIAALRARLATLDPHTEQARKGYMLLGNALVSDGRAEEAAAAWRTALAARFTPDLAVRIAAVILRSGGQLAPEDVRALRRALAEAPENVPWRAAATAALKAAGG